MFVLQPGSIKIEKKLINKTSNWWFLLRKGNAKIKKNIGEANLEAPKIYLVWSKKV